MRSHTLRARLLVVALLGVLCAVLAPAATTRPAAAEVVQPMLACSPSGYSGGTVSQATVLQRANDWVAANVPYDQGACENLDGTYREDCSGFVSMAWELSSSLTTYNFDPNTNGGDPRFKEISRDSLLPADALVIDSSTEQHIVLFTGWASIDNGQHRYANIAEESQPGVGTVAKTVDVINGLAGFTPIRYVNVTRPDPARHSSVGSSADGMYVAYADPSGNVVHDWRTSDGVWHGPYGLGGTARADSPIVSSADGFYVTFIDPSGNVVHDWRTSDGVWHGPYALGGTARAGSGLAVSDDGMYVAFADPSGNVVHDWKDATGWNGPYALGGTARADSPIASSSDGFYISFIDPSGNVVHDWRTSDGVWHGPYGLGGSARAGSGLASSSDGFYVAFVDPSGNVVHDWKDATGWNGPYALGGTARADSPITSSSDGFYISFIDPSGNVVHDWRTSDGVWHGPYNLGGTARAGSGLASSSDGFYVAFVDPSGNVVHDWKDATGWNGPYALGGTSR
jgi:hypothetical protein